MNYCHSPFSYRRRKTREVRVGHVGVGGDNPIRVQSMITSDTMNTEACIAETLPIVAAGCEIIR
ncbi:MAG: 4-hydroxy-3-methylbut-2-en-1-yl diphosphate synthase, partial [Verrucomicrobia bacterium]|nr:4-hydroxy-3-methylbut-2-en-1-yl diphosphate synthase [Verrucomicrobiota bacterium]